MVNDKELTAEGPLQSPVTIEVHMQSDYYNQRSTFSVYRLIVQEKVAKYTAIITCLSIFHMG